MKTTYQLNINGTSFGIHSDESEEYIRTLEKKVSDMIEAVTSRGASGHKAALFVCMELCDKLEKLTKTEEPPSNKKQKKQVSEVFFPDDNQVSLF